MKNLTRDQFMGILRHVLTFLGGFLVIQGIAEESLVSEISGAIVTLAGGIWSIVSKNKNKKELE